MQYLNPAHRLVFGNGVLVRGRRQTATSPERPASPRVADGPRLFQSPRITGRLSGRPGSRCGGCGGSERTSFDRPNARAGGWIPTSRRGRRVWCSPSSGRRSSPLPAPPRCRGRGTARTHCAKASRPLSAGRGIAPVTPGAVGSAQAVVVGLSGGDGRSRMERRGRARAGHVLSHSASVSRRYSSPGL